MLVSRRLLPSEAFNGSQEALLINGGGAYYSFTRKTYESSQDADIRLVCGVFSVGFVGILVSLGEISVSQVIAESPQTKFLVGYEFSKCHIRSSPASGGPKLSQR